ncbi:hypothetical protein HYH02_001658 [Chlamydomonas schloesseri]|uniref:Uncharacterized protein n=1 Tax=Chlamydomonas schloesseri TaxID=2026947 RepID=A0A835WVX6_9CHLO|nr:hypothetical protein HYH02_001658 [Chlamydomonas schloesseri]|eukprot:KAG2453435.1 hypothetical protein HYH02_001658 [Chlamydomonas schloesseri]
MAGVHHSPHLKELERARELQVQRVAKVQALFQYLNLGDAVAFDRCLARSGKSPEWLGHAVDGGPTPRKFAALLTTEQSRKVHGAEGARHHALEAKRREQVTLTPEEVMKGLEQAFEAYTDPLLLAKTGRKEMNIVGFCRFLRDCHLLDNRLTLVHADVIFTKVDAGNYQATGAGGTSGGGAPLPSMPAAQLSGTQSQASTSTLPGDLHINYTEFLRCMAAVVRVKFPHAADPHEALLLATRKWVLPFARLGGEGGGLGLGSGPASAADSLFDRSIMNLLRTYDGPLKRLYAWYTCMEETDPTHVTWTWVHEHGGTLDSNNFVLMLLNFGVLPVLLSKHEALDVFVRCEARNDGDEKANAVLYPTFLEALAEVALAVGDGAASHIRSASSNEDLAILQRYADCCPPPLGTKLSKLCADAQRARGRDAAALEQQQAAFDAAAAKQRNAAKAAEAAARQNQAAIRGVVERRENLRQRFALTRLRNFYRDVRTTNNNTTWPPERDASPTTRRSGAGTLGAGGAGTEAPEEGGVHVAFYDSERAIKTPRPVWIPNGPPLASRRFSVPDGTPQPTASGAAAAAAAAAASIGVHLGGAAGNMLLLDSPSGAAAPKLAAHRPSVLQPPSPGAYAAAMYGRTPKPYQLKVSIEDRDEHEAILDLAGRLPHIRTPADHGHAQGHGYAGDGGTSGTSSSRRLTSNSSRRAVTAPAEMRRGRPSAAGATSTTAAAAAETTTGGLATGAEGLQGEASGQRQRLPAVQHQLHRLRANSAALAAMAGQAPPHPYSQHPIPQQQLSAPPVIHPSASAPSVHLPAAAGASFISYNTAHPPHHLHHHLPLSSGASNSSLSGLTAAAAGTSASPVVPIILHLPLGPSTSQLSALGVVPAGPVAGSPEAAARASLTRRKASQRARRPEGALPNLKLPAEGGPSAEAAAALKELDAFDGVAAGHRRHHRSGKGGGGGGSRSQQPSAANSPNLATRMPRELAGYA